MHPLRPAGIADARRSGPRSGTRSRIALAAGIDAKGASIDDFRHVDGARGSFQDRFLVYAREGEPCATCGRPIRKLIVGGRGTYVCETLPAAATGPARLNCEFRRRRALPPAHWCGQSDSELEAVICAAVSCAASTIRCAAGSLSPVTL